MFNTAQLLLTEIDNKQPFTLTARITPTFLKTYDAGTLYIYVKDDLWLKMAMEMDERNKTRMVRTGRSPLAADRKSLEISERGNHAA